MPLKGNSRKKVVVDDNEENSGDLNEPAIELQKNSVMANGGVMELANENKKESEVFTDIEPQGDGEVFVDEAFDSFLMRDALLFKNGNGMNSWVSEAAIAAEHDSPVQIGKGQKRPFGHTLDMIENENLLGSPNKINDTYFVNLKKHCADLEDRIKNLEERLENKSRRVRDLLNIGEDGNIVEITKVFGIVEKDFLKCKRKTSTATARRLIRFKYPNPKPDFRFADVDKSIVNTIIECAKYLNPYDTATDVDLRKAMSNYFSTLKYRKKVKAKPILDQPSAGSKSKDCDNRNAS